MRRFNMNITEVFLSDLGNIFAILLILSAIWVMALPGWFEATRFWGGVLAFATFTSGLLLGLGSGGIRQNRSALELSFVFTLATGIGWLVHGVLRFAPLAILLGLAVTAMFVACWLIRREGVRGRFTPRFFSLRQFETMVQIADAMLDSDDLAIHPVEVALRADHFLAEIDSPVKKDIRKVMFLVEWLTPLLVLRPFPFSDLGTHERREIIRKVIWSRGLFRDVARTLKLLSTFPYYTHPQAREQIGYVDFDARERARGLDQTPKTYPVPSGKSAQTEKVMEAETPVEAPASFAVDAPAPAEKVGAEAPIEAAAPVEMAAPDEPEASAEAETPPDIDTPAETTETEEPS
jgi:hypothetical protein